MYPKGCLAPMTSKGRHSEKYKGVTARVTGVRGPIHRGYLEVHAMRHNLVVPYPAPRAPFITSHEFHVGMSHSCETAHHIELN